MIVSDKLEHLIHIHKVTWKTTQATISPVTCCLCALSDEHVVNKHDEEENSTLNLPLPEVLQCVHPCLTAQQHL